MIISYGMYYNRSKIRNQPVLKKFFFLRCKSFGHRNFTGMKKKIFKTYTVGVDLEDFRFEILNVMNLSLYPHCNRSLQGFAYKIFEVWNLRSRVCLPIHHSQNL